MSTFACLLAALTIALGQEAEPLISYYAPSDFLLTADPAAEPWKGIPGAVIETGLTGQPIPNHRTEIRSRWTNRNLYLLFICHYETLNLHPNPDTTKETDKLWLWDVVEAQIGSDLERINLYKEFQVSPQGEWVDADIDRNNWNVERQLQWNSGFKVKARIDSEQNIWYGEMQIPMYQIAPRRPTRGTEMRANFIRSQSRPRKVIAWRPTKSREWHAPEVFGQLLLR